MPKFCFCFYLFTMKIKIKSICHFVYIYIYILELYAIGTLLKVGFGFLILKNFLENFKYSKS